MSRYLALLREIEEKTRQGGTYETYETGLDGLVGSGLARENSFSGWLRTTCRDGTERIFWPSDPSRYPGAEPFEIHIRKPDRPLEADDEQRIRGALEAIQEDDPAEVEAVVEQCRIDADARSYWLRRATELLAPTRPKLVTCGACQHFDRSPDHPHLGHCEAGCRENPAGLWDDDSRLCGSHQSRGEQ